MSRKKIKFSHKYAKPRMSDGSFVEVATLLHVQEVFLGELRDGFLSYDTDGVYKLPKSGKYMMLLFLKAGEDNALNLFTTLRRWTPEKELYYRECIGKEFNVVYEDSLGGR